MKGHARSDLLNIIEDQKNMITITVHNEQKKKIIDIVNYCMKNPDTLLDISFEGRGKMISASKGMICLKFNESLLTRIESVSNRRSMKQNSVLRGIERFIFIAENEVEPTKDDLYWIHEGLLEQFSTWAINPRTGISIPKRTSDPSMTTTEMSKIVQGALNTLSVIDIPKSILDSIGHDMKKLWENWYRWRYDQERDPLFDAENELVWEKYKELHPVCELCGLPDNTYDPLIQMHIISKGSDTSIRDRPWNWLRSHNSHHNLQHNEGWEIIEKSYPHIKGKLKRARLMQDKGE